MCPKPGPPEALSAAPWKPSPACDQAQVSLGEDEKAYRERL